MADAADMANDFMDVHLEESLARLRMYEGESLTDCELCGEEIPELRRVALPGVRLCIDCQETRERL